MPVAAGGLSSARCALPFFDSLGLLAQIGLAFLPNEVFSILPYTMMLLVLILTARSRIAVRERGR